MKFQARNLIVNNRTLTHCALVLSVPLRYLSEIVVKRKCRPILLFYVYISKFCIRKEAIPVKGTECLKGR